MNNILRNFVPDKELNTLSLLVISNLNFCTLIREALFKYYKTTGFSYKLRVHNAGEISDITIFTKRIHADFVIFILDTRNENCVREVVKELGSLDSNFLIGRIIFVNGTPYIPDDTSTLTSLSACCIKYQIPLINGDVMDPEKCLLLAERIMIFVNTCYQKKVPFLPWIFS